MTRDEYFEGLKALAREKRKYHAVRTDSFGLREIRQVYKKEGIRIDPWPLQKLRAYICARTVIIRSLSSALCLTNPSSLFWLMNSSTTTLTRRKLRTAWCIAVITTGMRLLR
jgi:hypothetical protein